MIKEGVLEAPDVDYMLGLHVEPQFDVGKVGIKYGKMYAASDMIDVIIHGKSAHGAHPDQGVDVICVAAEIITAVQDDSKGSKPAGFSSMHFRIDKSRNSKESDSRQAGNGRYNKDTGSFVQNEDEKESR